MAGTFLAAAAGQQPGLNCTAGRLSNQNRACAVGWSHESRGGCLVRAHRQRGVLRSPGIESLCMHLPRHGDSIIIHGATDLLDACTCVAPSDSGPITPPTEAPCSRGPPAPASAAPPRRLNNHDGGPSLPQALPGAMYLRARAARSAGLAAAVASQYFVTGTDLT
jgi:hypothetical protein